MVGMTQLQPALALEFRALRSRIEQHARDLAVKRGRRMHDIGEDLVQVRRGENLLVLQGDSLSPYAAKRLSLLKRVGTYKQPVTLFKSGAKVVLTNMNHRPNDKGAMSDMQASLRFDFQLIHSPGNNAMRLSRFLDAFVEGLTIIRFRLVQFMVINPFE